MLDNFIASLPSHSLNLVVLTGAGFSAESGIKTFRDNNGLWENHAIEEVATPEGFEANSDLVYRFYHQRRQQLLSGEVHPNLAHIALATLEQKLKDKLTIVTQNVDDLHQRAGSKNVLQMHGSLLHAKCVKTGAVSPILEQLDAASQCTCCTPTQSMRPDIVWFGEYPKFMEEIEAKLSQADLFVSIGTSGNVYPAAGFVSMANRYGAATLELNLEPSQGGSLFDEAHYGPASKVVPMFVECLMQHLT